MKRPLPKLPIGPRTRSTAGPRLAAAALGLSVLLTSCIHTRRPIVLDSTPPGAVVMIDGAYSGHSTPCTIQLPDARRTVEFVLDGYETETREMRVGDRKRVVYARDAAAPLNQWTFPLFLGFQDFLFPIKRKGGEMPSRIHVRMIRKRQPLAMLR